MTELDQLGADARAQLGEPPEIWLRAQRQRLLMASASPPRRKAPFVLAAVLAVLAALGIALLVRPASHEAPLPAVALSAGADPRSVTLEGGSSLVLRPGARALVEREAAVTRCDLQRGSVDFDIAPQQSRRFVVLAGAIEVTVVGTRFSVAHEPSGAVEVRVSHGVVSVRAPNRAEPTRVSAGQTFRTEPSASTPSNAPPSVALPAVEAPLPEVAAPEPSAARAAAEASWESAYRERRYAVALERAKAQGTEGLLGSLPAGKLASLADAARLGGDSALALRILEAIERRFPSSPEARDATFLSGRLFASRGNSAQAMTRFERYLAAGERAPYATEAMGRLVELYSSGGDPRKARDMAQRYLNRAPEGPYRRLCESILERP